jgi:hypothetical protein
MEVVKRNANSKEIVAITVQENATGMMMNTRNNAFSGHLILHGGSYLSQQST